MSQTQTNIQTEAFVVLEPKADFKLMPIILDEVRDDEVLVEMKYSGICHTVRRIPPTPPPLPITCPDPLKFPRRDR